MRNRESEREREEGASNTKEKRDGRKEGAKICGYGRHPMAKLAGETMAKCQAGPPLRIETGRSQEWHTRGTAVQVALVRSDEYHKEETSSGADRHSVHIWLPFLLI